MLPIRKLVLAALLLWPVAAHAESGVKVGVLKCHIEPSVGLIFIGREKLECRFTPQDAGLPAGRYAGAITTIEKEVAFKDLPRAVADAYEAKYPKATYKTVEEVIKVTDGKEKLEYYEAVLVTADKKTFEVEVTPPAGR
jgi:hypothetical protein